MQPIWTELRDEIQEAVIRPMERHLGLLENLL